MALTDAQSGAIVYDGATGIKNVTIADTIVVGDGIGYSSGWKRALATTGTAIQVVGIAMAAGVSGDVIPVCFGQCIVGGSRFSATTVGAAVYGAEGSSNGQFTETKPTTGGDCNKQVGIAIDATTIFFDPNANVASVA